MSANQVSTIQGRERSAMTATVTPPIHSNAPDAAFAPAAYAAVEPAPLRAETSQPLLRSTHRVLTVTAICSGLLAFSAGAPNA